MEHLHLIESNNQRVLTTANLAEAYGTDEKRISENFIRNKERYILGKHFLLLQGEELRYFKVTYPQIAEQSKRAPMLYVWTEKGAWMHAKSLNTPQAWNAYDSLVDDYYNVKVSLQGANKITERDKLHSVMKLAFYHDEDLKEIKQDVATIKKDLEQRITVNYGQQQAINNAVKKRVHKLWDENVVNKEVHKTIRKLYSSLWKDLKAAFAVNSYCNIREKDFEEAIKYVQAWRPRLI
ncbi:ORF6N domain-containing protein [Metabacillus indicus]|uniref:ORF6N domain-containing protein n=1 Tax=Metabacillus indicus TaxID=246786 RepID=UPI002A079D73|nr:ORF6N domain-containing protein [Metabacillus indicus]MDX8291443.1 ORF6N domain-containing protein [Metabacillus indicus]